MSRPLTTKDLRSFINTFAAVIELDQILVDTLPQDQFHILYCDSMWRNWRRDHLNYLERLAASLDSLTPIDLERMTWTALLHKPEVVREAALYVISEAVLEGDIPDEPTAKSFFNKLMRDVMHAPTLPFVGGDAATRMMGWLRVRDPLRIAQDPECGYGEPAAFLN